MDFVFGSPSLISVVNLKKYAELRAIQLERCIMRRDSISVPNLGRYAELLYLFIY
jgi:hypothetical protein